MDTESSFINRYNADLIEQNERIFRENPELLSPDWRAFFYGWSLARERLETEPPAETGDGPGHAVDASKQARVIGAIYAYRSIGHTQAKINPLADPKPNPRLGLDRLGLTKEDLDQTFDTGNYLRGLKMQLGELLGQLSDTYCGTIGVEYLHIQETRCRRWLQAEMEPILNKPDFPREKRVRLLDKIMASESFENFLHQRYPGQKRFSLQGGETIIAALDTLLQAAPANGVKEIIMGMAHRGRLNVLANILGKSSEFIFQEFDDNYTPESSYGDGDVKYHLGYNSVCKTLNGKEVDLRLAANPSHLEAVNPVVEGRARARQRHLNDLKERSQVIPVLIHGDAAFAGQGVVSETLNLSKLPGYTTGGTIHFIINNQIGFTTGPEEGRSTFYCTDVAKMIEAPIFHVNGEDPVAVAWVTELALRYRQKFHNDVVIDMYCYRRLGHNEADEPAFTHPLLYKKIKSHPVISEVYANNLIEEGHLTPDEKKRLHEEHYKNYEAAFERANELSKVRHKKKSTQFVGSTARFQGPFSFADIDTSVSKGDLAKVANTLTEIPGDVNINPKIRRQIERKAEAFEKDQGIDWAFAEQLSWGTLQLEGSPVRLSGQDSERGTFSQRHATFYDVKTRKPYTPLKHLPDCPESGTFCVHNSSLSEAAVLGFDFGYSLDYPEMLCMWEAQFGDFVNGAQVIIDQFISSSESKWQRLSGIVLLLPHGYEGQGPEHSSARLERFLQLGAEDNIQVCNMTTPAQYFHVLRRQIKRNFRKPLVVMSPKSLLRHKDCQSKISEFTDTCFQTFLDDPNPAEEVERLILCSGKVYYDLAEFREVNKIRGSAIVRVEQLYPLDRDKLRSITAKYRGFKELVWCQEESRNNGAWSYIAPLLEDEFGMKPIYAGRDASASPAVGSLAMHKTEQAGVKNAAFFD